MTIKDEALEGMKFGRLTAIKRVGSDKYHHALILCKCDCGNETVVLKNSLTSGRTRSCGCYYKETRPVVARTHGCSKTRLFRIWAGIHERCSNPNNRRWEYYGGKGITVCDEWSAFEPFKEWAEQNGYDKTKSIDRIDCSKGYSPENCRWADDFQQMNNTTRNRHITINGRTQTLSQWLRECHLSPSTFYHRTNRGLTEESALFTPKWGQRCSK